MIAAGAHVTPTVRLLRPLGAGGMGSVWVAEHLALQTHVVVKFMSAELSRDQMNVERFAREAAAASQVKSPHVVQMFDHGVTEDGVPFIVMEYLEGHDVMWHLKQRGRFTPQEVGTIVVQTCKALSKAHEKGIVHRDIKPENIFVLEGDELFVKLLDFGVAKAAGALSSHTGTGAMIGTPFYMSPEQIVGAHGLDFRADLWSLGVVAFELLTGKKPFDADTIGGLAVQIHNPQTPRPSQLANDLPLAVDAWFMRACARNPDERFQSAKEMAQECANAVGGLSASMLKLPAHVAGAPPTQQSGGWGATPPPSHPRPSPEVPQLQPTAVPMSVPPPVPPPAPLPIPRQVPDAFAETAMPADGQLPGMPEPPPQPQGFPPPPQGFPPPPQGFPPPPAAFTPSMASAEPVQKKSKAPLIIALVVLLLLVGGGVAGYFVFFQDEGGSKQADTASSADEESPAPKKKKKPKKSSDDEEAAKPEPSAEPEPEPTAKPAPTPTVAAPKPTATATATATATTKPTTTASATTAPTTKPTAAPTGKKPNDDDIK